MEITSGSLLIGFDPQRRINHEDNEDDTDEILPCPFCGGAATVQEDIRYPRNLDDGVQAYEVVCSNLKCVIYNCDNKYFLNKEEAINAWNTRYLKGEKNYGF